MTLHADRDFGSLREMQDQRSAARTASLHIGVRGVTVWLSHDGGLLCGDHMTGYWSGKGYCTPRAMHMYLIIRYKYVHFISLSVIYYSFSNIE